MQIYAIIIFYKPFEHMLFSYAIEGFLGWGFLGLVKRLRQWSYVTGQTEGLRVGCGGWVGRGMDAKYMYCLPPAGVLHSQNKVINAP
jgi:hypothetical protein